MKIRIQIPDSRIEIISEIGQYTWDEIRDMMQTLFAVGFKQIILEK